MGIAQASAAITLGVMAFVHPARAQIVRHGLRTKSMYSSEIRVGGTLTGCELDFDQLLIDTTVSKPHPVFVQGTIAWMEPHPQTLVLFLKLVPREVTSGTADEPHGPIFTPQFAYASFGNISTAGREASSFPCENGGYCAVYNDQRIFAAAATHLSDGFRIAFQRSRGDIDVESFVTVPTPDQAQWPFLAQFGACAMALLQSFQ